MMTTPLYGRGAWTSNGMGNNGRYYMLVSSGVQVGSHAVTNPALDLACNDYRAVNWGVKQIQTRCNELVKQATPLVVDGWFGARTDTAVRAMQQRLGVNPDGQVGPATAKAMWRPLVVMSEGANGLNNNYLGGIMSHESLYDPGAVGSITPGDKGLLQWHNQAYAQSFDYHWSIPQGALRFATAWRAYAGKGEDLQIACSIGQHNSPTQADAAYVAGKVPEDTAFAGYIADVLRATVTF